MSDHEREGRELRSYDDLGSYPNPGDRAVVVRLGSEAGLLVEESALRSRQMGAIGTVLSWIPGHGGDAWWLRHDDGGVGAYLVNEIGPLDES